MFHGVDLDHQVSKCECQIPVRLLDGGDHLNGTLAKLRIAYAKILFRDLDLAAIIVDPEISHQRLHV
jgi:hypothetical protein